jgi:hypothetical protein
MLWVPVPPATVRVLKPRALDGALTTQGEPEMRENELLQDLDRSMDSVFDAVNVLMSAMSAIMKALPHDVAARVVPLLDEDLASHALERNPPKGLPLLALRAWRNQAAKLAGLPCKSWPS